MYVSALDSSGGVVETYGTKKSPVIFQLAEDVSGEPPAYPGKDAPARCGEKTECPPDFPGCDTQIQCGDMDWGATCTSSADCKCGLLCEAGTCETAPSCTSDAECPAGVCIASVGKCGVPRGKGDAVAPYKKNWVGLHVAQDIGFIGGADVCVNIVQFDQNFSCFYAGTNEQYYNPGGDNPTAGEPYPGKGIANGAALATTRILASYDLAFKPNLSAGVRAGFAFGGGPDAPLLDHSFLPIHLEARGTYWFRPLSALGFRPYVHVGGGMAQVDTKVEIDVRECGLFNDTVGYMPQELPPTNPPTSAYTQCIRSDNPHNRARRDELDAEHANQQRLNNADRANYIRPKLDVWKRTGTFFIAGGGGIVFAIKPNFGIQLNINAMLLLPMTGFALEPSLGAVMGF
jgi:hypothetical protein